MSEITLDQYVSLLRQGRGLRKMLDIADGPLSGSVAADDQAGCFQRYGDTEASDRIFKITYAWTEVASQQLSALAAVLSSEDNDLLGLFPLGRSAIEHCAGILWALDENLDGLGRSARAAVAKHASNIETGIVVSHLGNSQNTPMSTQQRQTLRAERKRIEKQFPIGTQLNDIPFTVADEVWPRPSELVGMLAQDKSWLAVYDYLCAVATHPNLLVLDLKSEQSNGEGGIQVERDHWCDMVFAILAIYSLALHRFVVYCGWDTSPLEEFHSELTQLSE